MWLGHGGIKMTRVVGTEASPSSGSELNFQTYRELLRQKEQIDKEMKKMQRKLFKVLSKSHGTVPEKRVKYVPRLENNTTLAQAIRECMIPKKEMKMQDILKSLSKKKLYRTDSKYFYTMVNNKLNRDPHVKKVSRGVFVFTPRGRRKSNAVA